MAERKKNASPRKSTQREEGGVGTSDLPKKGERIKEELDTLPDELDDLLEDAEEFVQSYVQRGGQ